MPLDSPANYPPTLREFLSFWRTVDETLGEDFTTREGDRARGLALEAELKERTAAVREAAMEQVLARARLAKAREEVRSLLQLFNATVRSYWAGTPWPELCPLLPPAKVILERHLRPCREGLRIWQSLEGQPWPQGAPSPLKLGPAPGVGRADYAARVEETRVLGLALEQADYDLAVARAWRDVTMAAVKQLLISFTRTLPVRVAEGSELLQTMPRLWALPGHTPEPVKAAGEWEVEAERARITWEPSEDEALDHYQIRACAGPDYDKREEESLGRVAADAERAFETTALLAQPGAVATFRVYVVLKTGNERASNRVTVERPVSGGG